MPHLVNQEPDVDKLSVFEAKARFSEVVNRAEEGKQTVMPLIVLKNALRMAGLKTA